MGVAVLQRPGEQYQRQAAHRQRVRGGRQHPKAFGIALGWKLLGRFYYEGRDYEFNFSKFWTGSRTFFDCQETDTEIHWKVVQTAFRAKMEVEISCPKAEMLLINYESPDGQKRHTRLWNCGNGAGTVRREIPQ